jgi:hypothetical protein
VEDIALENFRFPVIAVKGAIVHLYETPAALTTCTRAALKSGWFHDLLLVDVSGTGRRVRRAERIGTVGPFWGFDIFLSQRLRVALQFDGEPFLVSLPDLKRHLLNALEARPEHWDRGQSLPVWRARITEATSRNELLQLLAARGKAPNR